ncbi:MAG TPA: hypothetical protein VMM13_01300 [Euzebya sp.]|nr:hypothetical protein [Euzebya sp.]
MTDPVRWRESVLAIRGAGVADVVESGASAPLTAMISASIPAWDAPT